MTHIRPSTVISLLALFAALGGIALGASSVGSSGVISACYKTSGSSKGLLRVVSGATKCKKHEKSISWNQIGQAGAKGDTGAAGANGAKGDSGAAGTNGAKGDTGATGPSIAYKLRGTLATLPASGSNVAFTMSPGTWSQAAGEDQLIMGTYSAGAVSGCVGHSFLISMQIDSLAAVVSSPVSTAGTFFLRVGANGDSGNSAALFEPGTDTPHTLTATASSTCTGAVTNLAISVDVVSFK